MSNTMIKPSVRNLSEADAQRLAGHLARGVTKIAAVAAAFPEWADTLQYTTLRNTAPKLCNHPLVIAKVRELEGEVIKATKDADIATLAECQAALTKVIRVGIERPEGENTTLIDAANARAAAVELMKQRGDYEHHEHEGVQVVMGQSVQGRGYENDE